MARYAKSSSNKKDLLISKGDNRGGTQWDDMTGYGSDWPGTMKDQQNDKKEEYEQLDFLEKLKVKRNNLKIAEAIMRLDGDRYLTRGEVGILRTRWIKQPGSHDFLLKTYGPKPFKGLL
tara:strand:+ start:155 stop:511 length:357 start_codon:yes stop_codon:yes gene_type:complete